MLLVVLTAATCGSKRRTPEPVQVPVQPAVNAELASYTPTPKFGDYDPHEWEDIPPTAYKVHGIDISRWQTDIDWAKARNAGVSFAFMKATEGGDVADPMFESHWNGAKRSGMRYGAYHFYYFCRPAAEQAVWFIKHVPRDRNAMPHVLDMEWNHKSKTCPYRPDGHTVRSEARKFLNMLELHYGKRPIIYTTPDFFKDTEIHRMRGETFWLRSVAGHPREVYPGAGWTFWQYTGTGSIPGIKGEVDINVFAGTPDQFNRWRR